MSGVSAALSNAGNETNALPPVSDLFYGDLPKAHKNNRSL